MIPQKKLALEILLIISSVLIFRGLWMFLDGFPIMKTPAALIAMFALGLAATAAILHYYHKQ